MRQSNAKTQSISLDIRLSSCVKYLVSLYFDIIGLFHFDWFWGLAFSYLGYYRYLVGGHDDINYMLVAGSMHLSWVVDNPLA
jgi:hypothetical protein